MNARRNVLFIVLDSLRADHVSCCGYGRQTTPFIDWFAEKSVLFRQAIAPKYETVGVHASWWTGLYSSEHGITCKGRRLDGSFKLLPAVLRGHGYQTAGFSNNPFVGEIHGMDQGFDTFFEAPTFDAVWRRGFLPRAAHKGLSAFGLKGMDFIEKRRAERTVEKIASWFETTYLDRRDLPFFVFANLMDTHLSHYPLRRYRKRFIERAVSDEDIRRANKDPILVSTGQESMSPADFDLLVRLYDADIAYTDDQVGRLLQYMKRRGLLENTLVIVTSDHGDQFGENGLYGHMLSLADSLLHVPLIIRHPDLDGGRTVDAQVGTIHLYHTLLTHCGIDPFEYSNGRTGKDLLDADFMARGEPHVFAEQEWWSNANMARVPENTSKRCVRTPDRKYVEVDGGGDQLYDLRRDPAETTNRIGEAGAGVEPLKAALEQWRGTLVRQGETNAAPKTGGVDALIAARLKDLGYM